MSDLEKFTASAMRGPRKGVSEQLQAAKLVMANRATDPLQRIRFVAEAAWFGKDQAENDMDFKHVETLYNVALALLSTEKDKVVTSINRYTGKPFSWIFRYPVPWSFLMDDESYERHIIPWYKTTPTYWSKYVKSHPQQVEKSKVSCTGCGAVFLDLSREEAEKWKTLVEKKFKEDIKETKTMLITKERYEKEREKYSYKNWLKRHPHYYSSTWSRSSLKHYKYYPPILQVRFFHCPKCGKAIILACETEESNYYKGYDQEIYNGYRKVFDNEYPHIKVEDYGFYPPGAFSHFFWDITQWLTKKGYKELCNQFIMWADPIATRLERKLSDSINPQTFTELFRSVEEKREKEESEVESPMDQVQ